MKIIFINKLPEENEGYYFNYANNLIFDSQMTFLNANIYIQENQKNLIELIENWHSNLTITALEVVHYWWISQPSRILTWSPPMFQPLFFAISILEMTKEIKNQNIFVLNAPLNLIQIMKELFTKCEDRTNLSPKKNHHFLMQFCRANLGFLRNHLRDIGSKINPWNNPKIRIDQHIIFSQILNISNSIKKHDHFYGKSLIELKSDYSKKTTLLFHYPENKKQIKQQIKLAYNKHNFEVIFVHDLVNFFDVLLISCKNLYHILQLKKLSTQIPLLEIQGYASETFTNLYKNFTLFSHPNIIVELEISCAVKKIGKSPQFKKILYPYEEKSIERAILTSIKPNVSSYGFIHAAMHSGHICFNLKKLAGAVPPRPKFIYTTGIAANDWLIEKGYPKSQLSILGSPRAPEVTSFKKYNTHQLKILVIISQPYEINSFANFIENNPSLISIFHISVRKYPYGGIPEQLQGLTRLQKLLPNLNIEDENFENHISKNDIVLFSASSGGIEAIYLGAIAIYICLDEMFELNPIKILKEQTAIPQFYSLGELSKYLFSLNSLTQIELEDLSKSQKIKAMNIYAPMNLEQYYLGDFNAL